VQVSTRLQREAFAPRGQLALPLLRWLGHRREARAAGGSRLAGGRARSAAGPPPPPSSASPASAARCARRGTDDRAGTRGPPRRDEPFDRHPATSPPTRSTRTAEHLPRRRRQPCDACSPARG
jgi:hypothetical protein